MKERRIASVYYYSGYRKTAPSTKSLGVLDVKTEPAPNVPGNTEAERMSNALRLIGQMENLLAEAMPPSDLRVINSDVAERMGSWDRKEGRT